GGWTNWKMTRHHGTVAAAEIPVRGSESPEIQYKVKKKKSILEADVAQLAAVDPVNYSGRERNSPVFQSNKRPREVEANLMQKKLQISLNQNYYNEESDRPSSMPNPHAVSTGLKLSYDDEERNSSITPAS
nr:BOI-related E3 ubiquitin-protein ligase 1-like [Tanacetum cinerariifolium]